MKGIILAGGNGTRLYPTTINQNKGLLPVYDKPMIYYPLCTLIENGVKDICIISTPKHIDQYKKLLGSGENLGISLKYKTQKKPEGIAQAFLLTRSFIKNDSVCLILGDNIFYGASSTFKEAFSRFRSGGTIFGYRVTDPERYGIISFDKRDNPEYVIEKPKEFISDYAIPGLYLFDEDVVDYTSRINPSDRGELEITSVINQYLCRDKIKVYKINRGCAWLDAGTPQSLHESSEYIKVIEQRQGIKIGCIEEAAYNSKFINKTQLKELAAKMPDSDYKQYLEKIL